MLRQFTAKSRQRLPLWHSHFEFSARHPALPNDRAERTVVVGHRDCDRADIELLLHNDVAAATPNLGEAVLGEDIANFTSRENLKLTQAQPLPA
jgi:hypothetical protein